mmetsp:Transcript_12276/g.24353  ORF Transcript_12276/g.24353 Transcript_12276/m.24353 type:complete len:439 (+) Transcript_12276:396-1712(+)|eukprot:CAMPEP_0182478756 /NCGR_PEP_ID=MMETSP1319-20130603/32982_1 /TAXON_ID=172717 /ORGANISM="Bolidomonas pacifica, Strain RCC208" /LENGTH=438 /DNA_ID=CAMNT_0024680117 /DNA_START=310 /DNA_END=1626 /DNA_ORIENTATION=+
MRSTLSSKGRWSRPFPMAVSCPRLSMVLKNCRATTCLASSTLRSVRTFWVISKSFRSISCAIWRSILGLSVKLTDSVCIALRVLSSSDLLLCVLPLPAPVADVKRLLCVRSVGATTTTAGGALVMGENSRALLPACARFVRPDGCRVLALGRLMTTSNQSRATVRMRAIIGTPSGYRPHIMRTFSTVTLTQLLVVLYIASCAVASIRPGTHLSLHDDKKYVGQPTSNLTIHARGGASRCVQNVFGKVLSNLCPHHQLPLAYGLMVRGGDAEGLSLEPSPTATFIAEAIPRGGEAPAAAKAVRYAAYGSELAEAFRPVVTPTTILSLYGVTFTYMGGVIAAAAKAAAAGGFASLMRGTLLEVIFQVVANLIIPTGLVHLLVHYCHEALEKLDVEGFVANWGPTSLGLAVIPFLPLMDPFLEHAIEKSFNSVWPQKAKAA